jgi:hypothetical protein
MSEWTTKAKRKNMNLESFVPTAQEHVVRLEDKLAIMTMGSKDCYLSNFTLF